MRRLILLSALIIFTLSICVNGDTDPLARKETAGFIRNINGDIYTIEDYNGVVSNYSLYPQSTLLIDEKIAEPRDFKIGMEILGVTLGDKILRLESFSNINLGYIAPGSKVRAGMITKIDRDQIILRDSLGREETCFVSPLTVIQKNGSNVNMGALYVGDHVKLHFDEMHTQTISRMYIQGSSIMINDIYKAELNISDKYINTLTLENVQALKNGKWVFLNSSMTLPFNGENPLYLGGMKIDPKNLKYYKGKTVYMAVKDYFGKKQIEKMIIKSQYESVYNEKITYINWYGECMELSNSKNLGLTDAAIVIKNGRLVDRYSLNNFSDAFIISDGRGSTADACLIYIYNEELNNSNAGQSRLYTGRLDKIIDNTLYLLDFFHLNQNEWESFAGEKELYFDNDTIFYDAEEGKYITLKEFTAGNYTIDEKSKAAARDKLRDYYGYIYTDGDRIANIYIQKNMDSLLRQTVCTATIKTLRVNPQTGNEAVLEDVRDWNIPQAQWKNRNTDLNTNLSKALILKDGKNILPEELRQGDRIYLIRDSYYSKVILVK